MAIAIGLLKVTQEVSDRLIVRCDIFADLNGRRQIANIQNCHYSIFFRYD